ncbi:FAD-dependent oxidoreductase [Humibacillus xanthopallidus]|uniref:FAD-dependent oxidoreductase n=1 Tax=Humibacillus xanthopallidus TaxID=412689 RepID=UPI00384B8997
MTTTPAGRDRAVVLGAGIAGLVSALVLTTSYREVCIVERDHLADGSAPRRGTPQARHLHGLLARGHSVLEGMLPGLTSELVAEGAAIGDMLGDTRLCFGGHRFARGDAQLTALCVSRPALEAAIRRRVTGLPGIRVLDGRDIVGLTTDRSWTRVTGVRAIGRDDGSSAEVLGADLVVEATGRGSRLPVWLCELGYPQLDTDEVRVDVGYTTRQYRVPVGALGSDLVVLSGPTPDVPRGGGASRVEGDRWLVTLMGVLGDHPPIDAGGFVRFASDLALPEIGELVREAEPLDDPVPHRHPVSRRHHYERRDQLPDGVVVLGDALCALNPIYGQGMTVAALQAEALRAHLSRTGPLDTRRYQRHASRIAGVAWGLATGADLTFPGVAGDRHIANGLLSRYVDRVQAAAEEDPMAGRAFLRVTSLVDPPSALFRPQLLARVASGRSLSRGGPRPVEAEV